MSAWFKVMFPGAESEDELVLIYSLKTAKGIWEVRTPVSTFQIQLIRQPNKFFLFWSRKDGAIAFHPTVYELIRSVAEHRTGIDKWDQSRCKTSDYLRDWKQEVSDRVIFNFIDHWMDRNPNGDLREMVDYFEHEDTHLIDRMVLNHALKEMIVSGQLARLPTVWMPPAEMFSVIQLAEEYGIPFKDARKLKRS